MDLDGRSKIVDQPSVALGTQGVPGAEPGAREAHQWALDTALGGVVMFGGASSSGGLVGMQSTVKPTPVRVS